MILSPGVSELEYNTHYSNEFVTEWNNILSFKLTGLIVTKQEVKLKEIQDAIKKTKHA